MESYDLTTGTFSGTSKRLFYFSIAAFIAGAAMLVAGSVMLGVGIHKYNQNVDAAAIPPPQSSTTAGTSPSNMETGTASSAPTTTTGTTTTTAGVPVTTTGTSPPPTGGPPTSSEAPPTGSETPPTGSPSPSGAPDVLIMIDTSWEIGPANFDQIIDFVTRNVTPALPLGGSSTTFDRAGDQTNVAIVGFSDASVNIMSYYEVSDLASVQDALTALTLTNAKTNPSKALTVMNKLGSTKVDNTNVMMILASGTQDDLNKAAPLISQFQTSVQNFTFVALGAAGNLSLSILGDSVQTFNSTEYFLSDEDTNSLINGLNPTGATAVPATIPPPPPGPTCNKDIAILIDQSVTVGRPDEFNRQIDFLAKSLVYSWNISSTSIETFGLLYSQFGTQLLSTKPFNYNSTSDFIADLNAVKGKDPVGANDIVGGLSSLQSHLTNRRPNMDLVTILITYSSEYDFAAAVAESKNIGGNIIVVAVNTDPTNLYYLSGTVIETDKFFYDNITSQINAALCAAPVPPSPLPTMGTSPTPTPTATVPPPTCANDVAILIDQSVAVGNVTDFNKQIDFLTNTLVNTWSISPSNIETYGMLYSQVNTVSLSPSPFKYNSTQQFIADINNARNTDPKGYNDITAGLASLQSHLSNLRPGRNLAVILITYNDDLFDIMSAIPEAQNIPGKLIIVAVNTLAGNLYYLSGTVIQTDKDFNWDVAVQINTAICQSAIPPSPLPTSLPTPSPSTSTVTTPSTPPPVDYIPCRSNIVFALDASNNNDDMAFKAMKQLVTDNIVASNWTHFERVGMISYADASSCTYDYGTFGSKQDFDDTVNNKITKFPSNNSITFGIGTLMNTFVQFPLDIQNTIFFTSTSDPTDVAQAATNSAIIDYKGALIIVAVYPANKQNLLPLVEGDASKVIEFTPLSSIDYDVYATQIMKQFYCGPTTPTPSPSTVSTSSVTGPTRHGVSIYTLQTVTPQPTNTSTVSPSPTTTGPTSTTVTQTTPSTTTVTATTPTQSTPSVPYVPCQSWIYFGVDDSNVLPNNSFVTQLNFIASAIGNINHPERIAAIGAYNDGPSWYSGLSVEQIQQDVTGMYQGGAYNLRRQFDGLLTNLNNTQTNGTSVGALIFISDTSDRALANADQTFSKIQNVRITFVLLGPNADQSKLTKYSSNFITWRDFSQSQPDNWNNLYGPAYGCNGGVSTLGSTSTTVTPPSSSSTTSPSSIMSSSSTTSSTSSSTQSVTSPTSTTQTSPSSPQTTTTGTTQSIPFIPCQSWISFGADDSNNLNTTAFTTQLTFISSAIGNINHPERVQVIGGFSQPVTWNSGTSIPQIQNAVIGMYQGGPYSLRNQFSALLTNLNNTQTNNIPVGAMIFISDTSDRALANADQIFNQIQNVRITFVLLGANADQSKLTKYSSNFITWRDLSQLQPDNWNNLFGPAYGCTGEISTLGPTSTTITPQSSSSATSPTTTMTVPSSVSTTSPTIATTSSASSTQSIVPSSTPAPGSYYPCKNWVTVLADNSNQLTSAQFQAQLNFIKLILGQMTHFERIRYGVYNDVQRNLLYPWDPNNSLQTLQQAINSTNQTTFATNVLKAIQLLVADENQNRTLPDSTLIFVTDTSNNIQIQQAVDLYNRDLKNIGIKLTFILAGQNTNANALSGFDDAIFYNWQNIGFFPQPDRWDLSTAFRCSVPSSTTSGSSSTSTVSQTSPSTVTSTSTTQSSSISPSTSTTTSIPSSTTTTTSSSTSPTTPSLYIPCQSWIHFGVDDSGILNPNDYAAQLNFISLAIGSINHPERIQAFAIYDQPVPWNSGESISQIQDAVKHLAQEGQYRLRQQFAALVDGLQSIQNNTIPVGALIFIADTSDSALQGANEFHDQLTNVRITFVLLGPNAYQNKLTNFSSNFITWRDLSQPQPDNWNNLYGPAYGCSVVITTVSTTGDVTTSTTPSITSPTSSATLPSSVSSTTQTSVSSSSATTTPATSTSTTGPTPSGGPYSPCQVLVTTLVDISNTLSVDQFQKQLTFTKNIMSEINHPERIQYGAYYEGNGNVTYKWNDTNTQAGLQQAIDNTVQTSLPPSLAGAMRALSNNAPQNRTIPDSTIIFVTDTTNSIQIQSALNLYNSLLKGRVRITFILTGNKTDASKLQGFDAIFFSWQNMSTAQPVNWDLSTALRCTLLSSTTVQSTSVTQPSSTTTSTPSSTQSSSSTTTAQTTTTLSSLAPVSSTTAQTASTPSSPYIPCQSWIYFGVDDSTVLPNNNFMNQLNFISSAIGNITHPERIAANGVYSQAVPWNSGLSIPQIQNAVTAMQQNRPYILRNQFANLLTNLQSTTLNNIPVGALIFISDTSDQALQGALNIFNQIQNVGITFVLLGPNPDQNRLTQFSNNFITWRDLSQPQPDNWNTQAPPAYGCVGSVSTVSPVSTVSTSTLPTTVVSTSASQSSSQSTSTASIPSSAQTVSSSSMATTVSVTQSTTTSDGSYVPCQVLITTLVDISNTLTVDQFQKQLTFTKNILSEINHPERIQYGAYYEGNGNVTYKWNDTNTQAGLQQAIDNTVQSSLPPSLAGAMRALSNNAPQNRTIPDSTIIFVTDTTNSIQIQSALNLYNSLLKGRVRITFILTGNKTDENKLQGFDAIFFSWQNMSTAQPVNWDLTAALRCTTLSSTTIGSTVTTSLTQSPSTITSTATSSQTTNTQTATTPSSSYIPCQSWIYFGVDDSNVLPNNNFMNQLNFISSAIGNITHPERIAANGVYSQAVPWNSGLSIPQIQNSITTMQQNGPYSLRNQFANLLTNLQSTTLNNIPVGALIFISDTSDPALQGALNIFNQIQNVGITFVLLGPNPDQTRLTQFSNNFITWRDLSQPQPDNWNTQAAAAYGCIPSTASTFTSVTMSSPSSISVTRGGITVHTVQTVTAQTSMSSSAATSTSASSVSSTPTATGTAITTPEPYVPCQSWIAFLYDDSNSLSNTDYKTQMNFISTAITNINYPDRLLIQGGITEVSAWNSHQTIPQLQGLINNTDQTGVTYLLIRQLANLVTNLPTANTTNWPIGAIIFISNTSPAALKNAVRFMPQLANVQLTFVLLGSNVDASQLTNFTSNFIYWPNLSQPQPDNWDNSIYNATGCNGVITQLPPSTISTASPPSTQSSASPSTVTSTVASSTTSTTVTTAQTSTVTLPSTSISLPSTASSPSTGLPATQTTLVPYLPCQSWISFSYDDSLSLNDTTFKTQTTFIANATGSINYPDRLRVNGAFTGVASWNSHQTISQIQNELNNAESTSNSYSLLLEVAGLLTDVEGLGNTTWQIGALIFISDTSDAAIRNAQIYFSQLPPNVRITFVLLGSSVDSSKLTQFSSNFIYWSDLSQPQPDNWDAASYVAYGCSGNFVS